MLSLTLVVSYSRADMSFVTDQLQNIQKSTARLREEYLLRSLDLFLCVCADKARVTLYSCIVINSCIVLYSCMCSTVQVYSTVQERHGITGRRVEALRITGVVTVHIAAVHRVVRCAHHRLAKCAHHSL